MHLNRQPANISLCSKIVECLAGSASVSRVSDVRIGLGYTAVSLMDGRTGVAYTFRDLAQGGCSIFNGIRPLSGRLAADLLALVLSSDAIEAGVGLACANALASRDVPKQLAGDILEHLDIQPQDNVGMVGYFGPLVEAIRKRAGSLTIFERTASPTDMLRPEHEALEILPRCQVAMITATSIINHTIDGLLDASSVCREVAILGASTPLMPEIFADRKVTMLSGVVVREPEDVLRVISEGGGMRQFMPYVSKVSLRVTDSRKT